MHLKSHANTLTKSKPVIIIAHSARAMAESASRAGYRTITIDGFADLDTAEVAVESWCLPLSAGEFSARKLATCVQKVQARYPTASVIAGAGTELLYRTLETLLGRYLLGNTATCVQQVCNPTSFFSALDDLSIPYPKVLFQPPPASTDRWLYKVPFRCGGMGVTRDRNRVNDMVYWQRELAGVPISALCLCRSEQFQLIGINRQFNQAFSSRLPYVYRGALANYEIAKDITKKIISYIGYLSKYFKLNGLCSIDMLLCGSEVFVLELNPRVSATYELYERLSPSTNLIDAHIRVCEGERLSRIETTREHSAYSIVYADDCYTVPHLEWPHWASDRPEAGRTIPKYEPVCTVHALSGESADLCSTIRKREREIFSLIKQANKNTN